MRWPDNGQLSDISDTFGTYIGHWQRFWEPVCQKNLKEARIRRVSHA